jgi:hypothetical protein
VNWNGVKQCINRIAGHLTGESLFWFFPLSLLDPVFNALLGGPLKIWEDFDFWEETDTVKRMCFYCPYMSRPNLLTYSALREEFVVVKTGESSCKFSRRVAVQPSFLTRRILGCIAYPRLKSIVEEKSPSKFKELYNKKAETNDKKTK